MLLFGQFFVRSVLYLVGLLFGRFLSVGFCRFCPRSPFSRFSRLSLFRLFFTPCLLFLASLLFYPFSLISLLLAPLSLTYIYIYILAPFLSRSLLFARFFPAGFWRPGFAGGSSLRLFRPGGGGIGSRRRALHDDKPLGKATRRQR